MRPPPSRLPSDSESDCSSLRLDQHPLRLEGVPLPPAARRAGVHEGGAELQQRRRMRRRRALLALSRRGGRPQEGEHRGEDLELALDRAATVRASLGDGGGAIFGRGFGQKEGRPVGIASVPGGGGTAMIR